jgi:hypothetical protein
VRPLEHDSIFSVSRMAELLKSGTDSQRTVILFELQQLMEHCFNETVKVLVPVLCEYVHTWSKEVQISAAEVLIDLIQKKLDPRVCKMIGDAAIRVVQQTSAENMFEAWGEILVAVLPNVQWSDPVELRQVVKILDSLAVENEDVYRKLASRVFGALSSCLPQDDVERFVLPRAIELSGDRNIEVRGMIAESLAFIGAVTSITTVEKIIWPRLLVLLKDSDARIHAATLRTIAHILDSHRVANNGSVLYKEMIAPVFLKECEFARKAATQDQRMVDEDTYLLLEIVAEVFGQFVYSLPQVCSDESAKKEAYKAFLAMATCNGPIVRRYCAFNIPGVSKTLANKYGTEMSSIVEFVSRDTDSETRWNLAAGMHETASILASKTTIDNLFKAVITLLQDENPLVRMNTLEHFHPLLQSLTREFDSGSIRKLAPVFQNLTLLSEGNWRTQELLARQLEKAASLVPPDTLRSNVLPLLYQMSEESTYLVRKATMPAIAKALWCIPVPHEREETVREFRANWAEGGVFWMRLGFLDCVRAASHCFSASLFKSLLAASTLRMAEDPVPNVRLRLGNVIHEFAHACWEMPQYQHAIAVLREDNDLDVIQAISKADERINTVLMNRKELVADDLAREQAEAELLDKYQRSKLDVRKKPHGKGIFRPSTLYIKGQAKRMYGSDLDLPSPCSSPTSVSGNSPVSDLELIQGKSREANASNKRSSIPGAANSPRGLKANTTKKSSAASEREGTWTDTSETSSSLSSPKKKLSVPGDPSEEEEESPRSFGKKLLLLGKKTKK